MTTATTQGHDGAQTRPMAAPNMRKQRLYLRTLIKEASRGDSEQVQTLLRPFVSEQEEFVSWGISAKLGLIPRYNFYFLTDRRVGDLEITPFTGNLNLEMAYLHKIDAVFIRQPSLILLRLALGALYLSVLVTGALGFVSATSDGDNGFALALAAGAILSLVTVRFVLSPVIKRVVLRYLKSGMILKLTGGSIGTFIFADRKKMTEMSELSRQISDLKRRLDLEAA